MITVEYNDLSLTLKTYAKRGCPLFQLTKLVDGYDEPFTELTSADFRAKVGQRIKGGAWSGSGYTIVSCDPVAVV